MSPARYTRDPHLFNALPLPREEPVYHAAEQTAPQQVFYPIAGPAPSYAGGGFPLALSRSYPQPSPVITFSHGPTAWSATQDPRVHYPMQYAQQTHSEWPQLAAQTPAQFQAIHQNTGFTFNTAPLDLAPPRDGRQVNAFSANARAKRRHPVPPPLTLDRDQDLQPRPSDGAVDAYMSYIPERMAAEELNRRQSGQARRRSGDRDGRRRDSHISSYAVLHGMPSNPPPSLGLEGASLLRTPAAQHRMEDQSAHLRRPTVEEVADEDEPHHAQGLPSEWPEQSESEYQDHEGFETHAHPPTALGAPSQSTPEHPDEADEEGVISGRWKRLRVPGQPLSIRIDITLVGTEATDIPDSAKPELHIASEEENAHRAQMPSALGPAGPGLTGMVASSSQAHERLSGPMTRNFSNSSGDLPESQPPSLFDEDEDDLRELAMSEASSVSVDDSCTEDTRVAAFQKQFASCTRVMGDMISRLSDDVSSASNRDRRENEAAVRDICGVGTRICERFPELLLIVTAAHEFLSLTDSATESRWREKREQYLKSLQRNIGGLEVIASRVTPRSDIYRIVDKMQRFDIKLSDLTASLFLSDQILREKHTRAEITSLKKAIHTQRRGKQTLPRVQQYQDERLQALRQANELHRNEIERTLNVLQGIRRQLE
ncbi:hypothetical protein FA95DRAFT_1609660 [Auriscalpium vulgare]|uniref:Uncharacterized protein n=1 Tax=Auriscalpium vulgare TaxID=40419 RepID=A0ACB8RG84_9AGAM|nr:hypothetical protein FA95DRAFT_1609660 [Auriscalpium vulgare]